MEAGDARLLKARLTFADLGPIDEEWDPDRLSRGLIAYGNLQVHGAEKTAWTELQGAPRAGAESVTLPEPPTNWSNGDDLVIPGLDPMNNEDEERKIAEIDGSRSLAQVEGDGLPVGPGRKPIEAAGHTIEISCTTEDVKIDKLWIASDETTPAWLGHPAVNL